MLNLIACTTPNLGIGRDNELLVRISQDLQYFKKITTIESNNALQNLIVMGRKTWDSIGSPLPGRINIIITRNKKLITRNKKFGKLENDSCYFCTLESFVKFYKKNTSLQVFIIGGAQIFNYFLHNQANYLIPYTLYITMLYPNSSLPKPDTFINGIPQEYSLMSFSDKMIGQESIRAGSGNNNSNIQYRHLEFQYSPSLTNTTSEYSTLLSRVLTSGQSRQDRTNIGTIGMFGAQIRFDISKYIPIVETKRIPWKQCVEELLWFLRGDTDVNILREKGIKIWDGNTSRKFLDDQGLFDTSEYKLPYGYGWQWRFFGAEYSELFSDTSKINPSLIGGFDQIQYVLDELKNNPYSRRIMISAWNPTTLNKCPLVPCHYSVQFYVSKDIHGDLCLSCHYIMRSNDLFLGAPWNILSYAILTNIIALKLGMKPHELVYSGSDVHVYSTHIEQVKTQLSRNHRNNSVLVMNPEIATKDLRKITIDDFDIVGYFPDSSIAAKMAV